jgi:hypothetical protein
MNSKPRLNSKHGMGLLAAAGVAVGVVGITMGGASGATGVACTPIDSGAGGNGASNAASSDSVNGGAGAGAMPVDTNTSPNGGTTNDSNQNGAGNGGVGPVGPVGPTAPGDNDGTNGTDGSGGGIIVLPDLDLPGVNLPIPPGVPTPTPTLPSVPSVPGAPSVPSLPGGGSGGSSNQRPFVDVRANTTNVDAGNGAVQTPPNSARVLIRSDQLSRLLTIDAPINLGR